MLNIKISFLLFISLVLSCKLIAGESIEKQIKKKFEKKYNVQVLSVADVLIDSISKNGIYKTTFISKGDTLERHVIFINNSVYFEIRNKDGLGPKYTSGYKKLKKYLSEEQMKNVNQFFLRKYPPNF